MFYFIREGHVLVHIKWSNKFPKHTLNSVTSTSVMSLLLLYPITLGSRLSHFKSHSFLTCFPPIYHRFRILKINHQRIQPTSSHVACCHHRKSYHHCNDDSVLFHNVTWLHWLSHIRVNTKDLLDTMCTLVVTSLILQSLECIYIDSWDSEQVSYSEHIVQSL